MKVVAFGAHYDDVEIGCGGTLLKYCDMGHKVTVITVTSSEFSIEKEGISRSSNEARKEAESAAEFMGTELIALEKPALNLTHNENFVHEIDHLIKEIAPDVVLTHWSGDFHSDHAAVSLSTVRAARYVDKILLYRSNWFFTEQLFNANFYVDISAFMERKKELIRLYKSVLERVNYSWIDFIEQQNRADGLKIGAMAAESFTCIKYVER